MRLSYRIRVNDEWKEIGSYCRDGSRQMGLISSKHTSIDTSLFTRNGKSVTNKASFTLTWNSANGKEYQETIAHFLDAIDSGAIIECEIYDTSASSVLFGGYVDLSSLNITSGKIPESVSLSAKDYIIDLDKKIEDNLVFEDMPVNALVTSLLAHANAKQTAALKSMLDATDILEYFVVTAEDSFTYREIIDRLLFEWGGYVLYRNPSTDGYEIKKMLTPDAEPSHQVHFLVGNALKTTTGSYKKKGIVVDYPIVSTMENATLYQADISHSFDENGNVIGHILKPEEFYPENGEIQATYQEFQSNYLDREYQEKRARLQNSNIDLLYVKADSFRLQTNPSEGLDQPAVDLISKPSGTQLYPRKAWMLLRNNTSSDINLLTVDMTGTAVYKERIVSITMPKDAKDPEEYETSYVFSKDKALEFASFYIDWQNLSRTTATWTEHDKESSVGDIVVVKHKDSGIAQKYVVVEQTMKFIDANNVTYSNIAVALSGYNAQKDYVDSVIANKRIPTVIGTSEQYYYSTSKTELTGGSWLDAVDSTNENFMWRRTVTKYSNGNVSVSEAYFAGGEKGEAGPPGAPAIQPLYQWRLSASSTEPPADTIIYGDGGVYSSFDGALLVSAVDGWSDVKPSSTPEYPYIWERMSSDGGLTWGIPYCLTTIPVEALLVSASPSTFMLNDRRHCPESQTVIITVDRSSISSENECYIRVYRDGVMDDTEDGTGESKYNGISFSVDIPKDATTHKIEVEVSCGTHSKSVVISATYPEKPIPQRVKSLAATNDTFYVAGGNLYADENLSLLMTHINNDSSMPFVDGDYALCYIFDDEGAKKTIPYRYSSMSASWQVATSTDSNSADIMFGTLEDALKDKDVAIAQTSIHLAFIETLVASNAFISNLVIKKAIESTPFKWTDSEKIGFRIDAETGEIKANGMETVGMRAVNATIQGNITHDSLVTVDDSGADENTAISKSGTKDMWRRGDVFADLMKIDEGFPYRSMMSDISGNFNRLGIINSSYYKGSLSGSYNGSTQSLDYYAYSSSSNIAAGDDEHVCGKFKNNTGTYVLTYYEYNLDGVSNAIYLKVYDENDNYVIGTGLANESHSGYIYLPPGYTVTIKGMSTALWGNKTGSGTFIFRKSPNTLPPYRFQHDYSYNYEWTSNDSGILPAMYDGTIRTLSAYESDSYYYRDGSGLMYEFTAGPYTKYVAFFTAIAYAAASTGTSASYSVYINNVRTSPVGKIYGHEVYAVTPNATIKVYGDYIYTEETDEEGNTTIIKRSDMFIGGMTLAEYVDNPVYYTDRYGAYVHRDDGGALFYSINDNTYLLGTDSQKPVLTSPSYSPSYKKISGAQIVSAIASSVSKNKVIFVTGDTVVNVNGTSISNKLVSIMVSDSSVRFDFSDRAAIIINSSDTLDSFSCQFTILKTKAHIVLGMVEPKDSSIHIGTNDNRFNKVWSKDIDANGNLTVNGANHAVSIENGTITANKVWGAVFN